MTFTLPKRTNTNPDWQPDDVFKPRTVEWRNPERERVLAERDRIERESRYAKQPEPQPAPERGLEPQPPGSISAAILAASVGSAIFGLAIVFVEMSPTIKALMTWYEPVGPLSGKSTVGAVAFLVSWHFLHERMRLREVNFKKIMWISFSLLAVGLLLTFPPVYGFISGLLPLP